MQLQGFAGGRIETEGFWICVNKDTSTPSRLTEFRYRTFLLAVPVENHRSAPMAHRRTSMVLRHRFPLRRI